MASSRDSWRAHGNDLGRRSRTSFQQSRAIKSGVVAAEKARIDSELSDPAVYNGPTAAMIALVKRRDEAEKRLARAESQWLEAQSALEAAEGP